MVVYVTNDIWYMIWWLSMISVFEWQQVSFILFYWIRAYHTCNSLMMRFLLFPWRTTWACEISSSGTNGAGTTGRDEPELPPPLPPMITPAPELRPPPPRNGAEDVRMIRALVRVSWREDPLPPLLPPPNNPLELQETKL